MPFEKGQSGNPGGRPKENAEVKALAREHGPRAIARLVELMEGDDPRVAAAAATALLDRGYGKPGQSVSVSGDGEGSPIPHSLAIEFIERSPEVADKDTGEA